MKLPSRMVGQWKVAVPEQTRLDAVVAEDLKEGVLELVREGGAFLALDLSRVEFMDSSGLGAIVYCLQRMDEGGRIALVGPREPVALMLRLTHMDKVFTVVDRPEKLPQPAESARER